MLGSSSFRPMFFFLFLLCFSANSSLLSELPHDVFSWAPQICVCVATNLLAALFSTHIIFLYQLGQKGSLGNSSCATCQNQVNRWKRHCINQLMTRGEYFLEGGTAVKVQLAISYWVVSPDLIAVALSSTCEISKIALDNSLLYPMTQTNTNLTYLILKFN